MLGFKLDHVIVKKILMITRSSHVCSSNVTAYQSGTKPNLVAKILATKFGVFFVIHVMFSKICSIY